MPCGACSRFNIQCVYTQRDNRRREERETKLKSLQDQISELQSTINGLQVNDENEALNAFYSLRKSSQSDGSASRPLQTVLSMNTSPIPALLGSVSVDPVYVEQSESARNIAKANNVSNQLLQAVVAFQQWAQSNIATFGNPHTIVNTQIPDLELFMRSRREGDGHTVWTWSCELAKSYNLPFVMQLSVLYCAGIQMRAS